MQERVIQIPEQKTASPYRWVILMLATWIQTSSSFVTQGIGPLSAYWKQIYHLSQTETATLISAVNIGPILSMIILGRAIDRYGERWLLGFSAFLLGITMATTIFINHFYMLLTLLVFVGAWYGASQPGGSKAIVNWFPVTERGLAMGIRQIGIPLGGALAAFLLPLIIEKFNLNISILTQVLFSIFSGFIFMFFYRDTNRTKEQQKIIKHKEHTLSWIKIIKDKKFYPIFFVGVTLVSLQFILVAHYMAFLVQKLEISLSLAGTYLGIVQFSGMCGRIIMAWVSDKFFKGNRLKPLLLCICFTIVSIALLLFINKGSSEWFVILISILLGFFGIGWYSLYIVQISESSPKEHVAFTVSVGLTLNQLAIVIMPVLFGLIIDIEGDYPVAWIFIAIFIAISGVVLTKQKGAIEDKLNIDV
ncbi:MFS transporter [Anoxybacillus tepidamans]|uniref:MFS transporter n=1 Tax=Anoxybacteroides tepidamans TaxID=265948 RepID=UPI000487C3E7|nr:MFS transporter [Anoxybacillus tepidamans]